MEMKFIEVINTWQGEGPDAGRQMLLLRFKDCNRVVEKRPCPWCDTLVKMRVIEAGLYTIEDIDKLIQKTRAIMITGGEPLYTPNVQPTLDILSLCDYDLVNIETNGFELEEFMYLVDNAGVCPERIKIIYSPKFFSSEERVAESEKTEQIAKYNNIFIKLVVGKNTSLVEDYLHEARKSITDPNQIWLMPEGTNREQLLKSSIRTMDLCEQYGCNFSSRVHLMYDFV